MTPRSRFVVPAAMADAIVLAAMAAALLLVAPGRADARPDCDAARRTAQAAIDAACPCDGASDHGRYVRCVTQKLRELSACTPGEDGKRSCGPVPRLCAATIRRTAARSACGKPADHVACCVPKQRDCVGDQTPGDGKKDGTCGGTKRACDSITECLVAKCELSASAERCTMIGGTVGRGRDCARACD